MKTLHKEHAAAHALGQRALNTFRAIAADLRQSAERHQQVHNAANEQIRALEELRDSAGDAAADAVRQADAIEALTK